MNFGAEGRRGAGRWRRGLGLGGAQGRPRTPAPRAQCPRAASRPPRDGGAWPGSGSTLQVPAPAPATCAQTDSTRRGRRAPREPRKEGTPGWTGKRRRGGQGPHAPDPRLRGRGTGVEPRPRVATQAGRLGHLRVIRHGGRPQSLSRRGRAPSTTRGRQDGHTEPLGRRPHRWLQRPGVPGEGPREGEQRRLWTRPVQPHRVQPLVPATVDPRGASLHPQGRRPPGRPHPRERGPRPSGAPDTAPQSCASPRRVFKSRQRLQVLWRSHAAACMFSSTLTCARPHSGDDCAA